MDEGAGLLGEVGRGENRTSGSLSPSPGTSAATSSTGTGHKPMPLYGLRPQGDPQSGTGLQPVRSGGSVPPGLLRPDNTPGSGTSVATSSTGTGYKPMPLYGLRPQGGPQCGTGLQPVRSGGSVPPRMLRPDSTPGSGTSVATSSAGTGYKPMPLYGTWPKGGSRSGTGLQPVRSGGSVPLRMLRPDSTPAHRDRAHLE